MPQLQVNQRAGSDRPVDVQERQLLFDPRPSAGKVGWQNGAIRRAIISTIRTSAGSSSRISNWRAAMQFAAPATPALGCDKGFALMRALVQTRELVGSPRRAPAPAGEFEPKGLPCMMEWWSRRQAQVETKPSRAWKP